jgi:hypothetical protein
LHSQGFIPKLKKHLLPRIRSLLGIVGRNEDSSSLPSTCDPDTLESTSWQSVLFKHDRMYKHNLMHINYTAYDVRRDDDVIHTGNRLQCNVMVLAPDGSDLGCSGDKDQHPFWYARVLGIYHVNVIYIGEGNTDYSPRRLEFLWVRWYDLTSHGSGWSTQQLDRLSFLPLANDNAFGFLDPGDVLRACHIIPDWREGLACKKGPGLSCCAQDHDHSDYKSYVVNR